MGFYVDNVFYPLYWSCFDQNRLEVLYVWYEQNPPNAVHQTGVDRPSWLGMNFHSSFYDEPNINVIIHHITNLRQKNVDRMCTLFEERSKYLAV